MLERKPMEIIGDIKVLLNEIKHHSSLDEDDLMSILGSAVPYIKEVDNIWQMKQIVGYQYNQLGSFEMNLYRLLYGASHDNVNRLGIVFPNEVSAYLKFGREGVAYMKMKIEEVRC